MEAGAEPDESTPHAGKPSEMWPSVDDISSSCPGCVSPDSWGVFLSQITLPLSALASHCLRHGSAKGELTPVEQRCFDLGWPKLSMVNPSPQHNIQSHASAPPEAWECSFAVSFLPPLRSPKSHKQCCWLQLQEARERKEGCFGKLFPSGDTYCREWEGFCLHLPILSWAEECYKSKKIYQMQRHGSYESSFSGNQSLPEQRGTATGNLYSVICWISHTWQSLSAWITK